MQPGEVVKWSSRPNPMSHLAATMAIFLFAIPWTAFSIFWIAGAAGFKIPDFKEGFDFFPLFGLPFLFIGIGMLSAPLFSYLRASKIIYVITNQRAFEMYCGRSKKVINFAPDDIGTVERTEKPDGSGHLYFSSEIKHGQRGQHRIRTGFRGIQDVRTAETFINNLKSANDR